MWDCRRLLPLHLRQDIWAWNNVEHREQMREVTRDINGFFFLKNLADLGFDMDMVMMIYRVFGQHPIRSCTNSAAHPSIAG